MLISLPVIIETEQILSLWLKEVPEYTTIFFRLIIITTMIDAISNPFMRAVDATGNINMYQIVVGGILLMIVPVSYVVLKFGGAPYSVFIVHIVLGIIAFIARMGFVKKLIGVSVKLYFKDVILKLILVTIVSSVLPLILRFNFEPSILRFLGSSLLSVISVICSVYFIGLKENEKRMTIGKITDKIRVRLK